MTLELKYASKTMQKCCQGEDPNKYITQFQDLESG